MQEQSLWMVKRVEPTSYNNALTDSGVFFNEPKFTELNKHKVDDVHYLIIYRGNSARYGVIIGEKDKNLLIPFSAPYAYPISLISDSKQETIDYALNSLENYCERQHFKSIRMTFPPLFYDEHLLSGWVSALYRAGYCIVSIDLNYALDLKALNVDEETYELLITQKGRKGLRKARRSGLEVYKCVKEEDYLNAYDIIKTGHDAKGFPVHLSFDELMQTMSIVKHDAFIVKKNGVGIVAEFLYHINNEVVQGIYTGTLPDHMECNGMNLLTYHTIRHYGELGYRYLDKATAGKDSIPNYGLCNFKENVGCKRSLKFTFYKHFV